MSVTRSGRRSKRTCLHISGLQRPVCPQHPQKAKNKQTSLERHSSNMTAFDYLFASSNCLKTSYLHHLLAHHLSIQRPPEIKTEEKQRTKGQSNTNNLIQPEFTSIEIYKEEWRIYITMFRGDDCRSEPSVRSVPRCATEPKSASTPCQAKRQRTTRTRKNKKKQKTKENLKQKHRHKRHLRENGEIETCTWGHL